MQTIANLSCATEDEACLLLTSGQGQFARQLSKQFPNLTIVSPDPKLATALKLSFSKPGEANEKDIGGELAATHCLAIRTKVLNATGLPDDHFSFVMIEDVGLDNPMTVHNEAMRLLRPGGVCLHLSYLPFFVLAAGSSEKEAACAVSVNRSLVQGISEVMLPSMSAAEQHLLQRCTELLPQLGSSGGRMEAEYLLNEMGEQLASWPVARRLQDAGAPHCLELWQFYDTLKAAWGSSKKKRPLYWPVSIRVSRKAETAVATLAEMEHGV
jgi:hypothetical protein